MPKPATFTPAEISVLADRLREGWRPGSQINPWLKDHAGRLKKLKCEERFSWAAEAAAFNVVGIVAAPLDCDQSGEAVSEVRPSERGDRTTERHAELAAWKAEQNPAKVHEYAEFAR